MSELQFYLSPKPANTPIYTQGNWFWRGNKRFLIKGISYFHRQPPQDGEHPPHCPIIDSLTDDHLPPLRRDISHLRDLGLNTIFVSHLDPAQTHHKALRLLAENGFYVLILLGEALKTPDYGAAGFTADFDTQRYYTRTLATRALRLVEQIADHPNVLGFVVDGDHVRMPATAKLAEVMRAFVRDVKEFLRRRGGRQIPVGVSVPHAPMIRGLALEYFSAGSENEGRADFVALECWSWAYKSSFQISGWMNLVAMLERFPVPMFLGAFGSYTGQYFAKCLLDKWLISSEFEGRERIWQEIECLYSSDMTGVFSGGCLYSYREYDTNYGIVSVGEDGKSHRKPEFETLKQRFGVVNRQRLDEISTAEVKDYENWQGQFPQVPGNNRWNATDILPGFPADWSEWMALMKQDRGS